MKVTRYFRNRVILRVSDDHMVYKYDLIITIFGFIILCMWKLTERGKSKRTNYCSFSIYNWRGRIVYKRF